MSLDMHVPIFLRSTLPPFLGQALYFRGRGSRLLQNVVTPYLKERLKLPKIVVSSFSHYKLPQNVDPSVQSGLKHAPFQSVSVGAHLVMSVTH